MKVLITGASSYVGASVYAHLKEKCDLIGTYHTNKLFPELEFLDITDKREVKEFIDLNKPDFIVHVAANASGDWCEKNPEKAVSINQHGTENIVSAANRVNSKIIFISSFAVSNKQSLYGRTKAESENYVKKVRSGWMILRPSLIVGMSPNTQNDRPFNRILRNITEHNPAAYDISWKFQPTWLRHINEVIEVVIKRGIVNEIIPIAVPELRTRYDMAKDILTNFDIQVSPVNKNDKTPTFRDDLKKLKDLRLPVYTYEEMITGIINELKKYLKDTNQHLV
ncbi:MAG: sugar nucleotide-binding protein [Candidatus Aenigmarchaeota archaeon]|nr:sugar nucleotide-binding protein [Candidatus Aenigmarchaeota archaeon]